MVAVELATNFPVMSSSPRRHPQTPQTPSQRLGPATSLASSGRGPRTISPAELLRAAADKPDLGEADSRRARRSGKGDARLKRT